VYEGLYLMSIRNLKRAAELFVDTLPTFTCTEVRLVAGPPACGSGQGLTPIRPRDAAHP